MQIPAPLFAPASPNVLMAERVAMGILFVSGGFMMLLRSRHIKSRNDKNTLVLLGLLTFVGGSLVTFLALLLQWIEQSQFASDNWYTVCFDLAGLAGIVAVGGLVIACLALFNGNSLGMFAALAFCGLLVTIMAEFIAQCARIDSNQPWAHFSSVIWHWSAVAAFGLTAVVTLWIGLGWWFRQPSGHKAGFKSRTNAHPPS